MMRLKSSITGFSLKSKGDIKDQDLMLKVSAFLVGATLKRRT
ncbi:hypothetical protein [Thermodesulfatator atlanticus]